MRQLTWEEKELLKKTFNQRLGQEIAKMVDSSWEEAAARCRQVLTEIFTEMMLEKLLASANPGGKKAGERESPPVRNIQPQQQNLPDPGLIYLYCLAPAEAALLLKEEIIPGLPDGGMARAVRCGSLTAVVGTVPAETYSEASLTKLVQDPRWLESRVTGHEQVIRQIMKKFPVIPMKFCTIFHSIERVCQMVGSCEDTLNNLLTYVRGREEWGLKVFCNPGQLRRCVEENSMRLREARESAESKGSGAAYLMRKKMDDLIDEEVEKTASGLMEQVHQDISQCAVEAKLNRILGSEVTGRLERMSLNAVYLIECDNAGKLTGKVKDWSGKHQGMGFEYVLTGPWPPYNFTSVKGLEVEGKN